MPIQIIKKGITELEVDCVVNAANTGLRQGNGVCGAIFREAGSKELAAACDAIGHCPTGEAVITPGFRLKAKFIIHTPGPIWSGGDKGEESLLYSCYQSSLRLAMENDCHSIAFPLISSGIFGYPKKEAWEVAIRSMRDFLTDHSDYKLNVIIAVLDDDAEKLGKIILESR